MSEVKKSDWDVPSNPVLPYADSYRQMARTGTTKIDVWSVITDLERNIAPLWTAQRLRADTAEAELDGLRYKAELYDEVWADATGRGYANVTMALCALTAAEQRIAELLVMLRQAWVDTEVSAELSGRISAALSTASPATINQQGEDGSNAD